MTRNAVFIIGTCLMLGCSAQHMQTIRTEATAPTAVIPSRSSAHFEKATGAVCPLCGSPAVFVLRGRFPGELTECAHCGNQELQPHEKVKYLHRMGAVDFSATVADEEIKQIKQKVPTLRPNLTFPKIERTLGLERFANQSEVTRYSDGRLTMRYYLDRSHYILIVVPGSRRTLAPLMYVSVMSYFTQKNFDDWQAKLNQNGWQITDDKATGG